MYRYSSDNFQTVSRSRIYFFMNTNLRQLITIANSDRPAFYSVMFICVQISD